MMFISDKSKVVKSIFLVLIFLIMEILIHVALLSVVTFFHLQLKHRFVDIQDWIYVNGWFLTIIKLIFSFYLIEKLLSIVNYENNGLGKIFQDFKLDIDYKMPIIVILIMLLSCFVSFSPQLNSVTHLEVGNLLLSYIGHFIFFMIHTLFLLLLFNKMKLERFSKICVLSLYLLLVYAAEQVFFKFEENHERLSITFLFIIIYISGISEKKYLKLSFGFVTIFLCPFLTLFGLDLVWGSSYSPYILSTPFNLLDVIYLSATVGFFLYLHRKAKVL